MPEITSCPQCQRKLRIPDDLMGKRVKCPGCSLNFTATPEGAAAPAPPPPPGPYQPAYGPPGAPPAPPPMHAPPQMPARPYEDDRGPPRGGYDDDRPRRPSGGQQGWRSVRTGIVLGLISLLMALLGIGTYYISIFLILDRAIGPSRGDPQATILMTFGCVGLFVLGWRITSIIAYGFYMVALPRADARGLATTSLGTAIGSTLLLILWVIIVNFVVTSALTGRGFFSPEGGAAFGVLVITLDVVILILLVTEIACSLFFHKAVATTLRADGVSQSITIQIILGGVILLLWVGMMGMFFVMASSAASYGPYAMGRGENSMFALWTGCGCLTMFLSIGWGVWYIVTHFLMLGVVNGAIRRY